MSPSADVLSKDQSGSLRQAQKQEPKRANESSPRLGCCSRFGNVTQRRIRQMGDFVSGQHSYRSDGSFNESTQLTGKERQRCLGQSTSGGDQLHSMRLWLRSGARLEEANDSPC